MRTPVAGDFITLHLPDANVTVSGPLQYSIYDRYSNTIQYAFAGVVVDTEDGWVITEVESKKPPVGSIIRVTFSEDSTVVGVLSADDEIVGAHHNGDYVTPESIPWDRAKEFDYTVIA